MKTFGFFQATATVSRSQGYPVWMQTIFSSGKSTAIVSIAVGKPTLRQDV